MRVFRNLDQVRGAIKNPVVTTGSYDGIHKGHRVILSELKRVASQMRGESVVITFDPHPRTIVHNADSEIKILSSIDEKIVLLESEGIDNMLIVRFDESFSKLTAEEYTKEYLLDGIGAKAVIMGYDHRFGHDRSGDGTSIEGIEIRHVSKQLVDNNKVSSSVIRDLIIKGDFASAAKMLTSPYMAIGSVCNGIFESGDPLKLFPEKGIYRVTINGVEAAFDACTHRITPLVEGDAVMRFEP